MTDSRQKLTSDDRDISDMPDAPDAAGDDARVEAIARLLWKMRGYPPKNYGLSGYQDESDEAWTDANLIIAADPATSRIRALEEKNRALVEAQQWQPIETAPKDFVSLFDLWANGKRYTDCYWGKATYGSGHCFVQLDSGYDCNGPVDDEVMNATHWMKIPEGPKP